MKYVPNILTLIRIFLIPLFISFYIGNHKTYAFIVFVIAAITDLLDGYLARRFNLTTALGALLDPLADKLMLLSVLTCLSWLGIMPIWVTTVMYLKELFLVVTSALLYVRHENLAISSNRFGKAATVSFSLFILLILISPQTRELLYGVYFSMILKLIALISYIKGYLNHPIHKQDN